MNRQCTDLHREVVVGAKVEMVRRAGAANYTPCTCSTGSRHTGHLGSNRGSLAHDSQKTTCPQGIHLRSLCRSMQMTHIVVSLSGVDCEDRLERSARAARATSGVDCEDRRSARAARVTRATSRAHGPLLLRPTIKFTRSPLCKVTPFVSDTWKNTVLRGLTSVTLGALIKPNPSGRRCVTVPKWRSSAISSSGAYDGVTSARDRLRARCRSESSEEKDGATGVERDASTARRIEPARAQTPSRSSRSNCSFRCRPSTMLMMVGPSNLALYDTSACWMASSLVWSPSRI